MARRSARLSVRFAALALGVLPCGCDLPHHDVPMQGNADGVIINFVGNVADTQPVARQHCARYERVPVLRQIRDYNAIYACVCPEPRS